MFGIHGPKAKRIVRLEGAVKELQGNLVDILSGIEIGTATTFGNQYTNLKNAVNEIRNKFTNAVQWGCPFVQRIINIRKAMVMPYGLDVTFVDGAEEDYTKKERDDAMDVIKHFIEVNDFNEGFATDLAQEGEIEANVLLDLELWDGEDKTVKVRYWSWYDTQYKIKAKSDDSGVISSVYWDEVNAKGKKVIPGEDLVFIYFNGLLNSFVGVPTTAPVLSILENLHKTLSNWHRFNTLFGKVTPVFEVETEEEADKINGQLQAQGWKLGNAIALAGKFSFAAPDSSSATASLDKEIRTSLQVVSGHTGVGPHILGFPDVMSNRATGDSMGEPTEVVSITEISKWSNFYEDLFDKVITKHNVEMNKKVKPGIVKPKLLPMTDRQWTRAIKFWYPAARDGLVSLPLFLENIPDVNAEEEMLRQDNDEMVKRLLQVPEGQAGESANTDREDQGLPNSSGRRNEGSRSS